MIMQPETGKLSVKEKIGYSLGDGVASFIFQTIMLLQLSFYTNTFGIGPMQLRCCSFWAGW